MYVIDGVPLNDPEGRWGVESETQARTPVAFRAVDATVPGLDGSLAVWGEDVEASALGLQLNVWGDPEDVERNVNFLRGLLGKTHAPLIVERRDGLAAEAKPASISDPIMHPRYALVAATLTIPAGVWRGPPETWTGDFSTGQHVDTLDGSTRPVTDALVLVTGPANGVTLTDWNSGAEVSYTGNIPEGQSLLIDCGEWRATRGAGVTWGSGGSNVTRDLVATGPRSDVHLWVLTPQAIPSGTTMTRVSVSASGTNSASRVQMRGRTSHL